VSWLSKKLKKVDVWQLIEKEVARHVKKYDIKAILIKVGDMAVKASPNKADDILWGQIKKFIKDAKI
jgi:hypothetical protein|tara:strand:+ start:308 stop:508 length:201 start_codon:yes stop_codon:yes gene_type:complete